jgi:iron complex transport system ATP-binding protein
VVVSVAVRVDGIEVALRRRRILQGIAASAPQGAVTALVGPNAAGKTTLLRTIAGLLAAQRGRVEVRDAGGLFEPSVAGLRRRAASIAYLPQQIGLPAGFSVRELVAMGRHALGPAPAAVQRAIAEVGLGPLADRAAHTLSAGQRQRVALARCFAQVPAGGVLLLDEPFSALDLRSAFELAGQLRQRAEAGGCVLVSIHDLGLARRLAARVWLLEEGRLIAEGPTESVLTPGRLAELFGPAAAWLCEAAASPTIPPCPAPDSGSSS